MMVALQSAVAEPVEPGVAQRALDDGGMDWPGTEPLGSADETGPIPPPIPGPAAARPLPTARRRPPGTILYRRRTLYVHGLLFLLLGGGAFAAGYLVGREDATLQLEAVRAEAPSQRVLVEGKLYYDTGTGSVAPDAGAVVIVLPADQRPPATLSIEGLRPRDPPPPSTSQSLRKIEDFGGVYARGDELGAFRAVVPRQGRYRVLLISRRTTRDEEVGIDELDLTEMTEYFYSAEVLIGPYNYRWTLEEITPQSGPIEHNFGRSAEE